MSAHPHAITFQGDQKRKGITSSTYGIKVSSSTSWHTHRFCLKCYVYTHQKSVWVMETDPGNEGIDRKYVNFYQKRKPF